VERNLTGLFMPCVFREDKHSLTVAVPKEPDCEI